MSYLRTILGYLSLLAMQVAVLVWGWGLTPKSWPAILGLGVLGPTLTRWWLVGETADMQRLASARDGQGPDEEGE